MFDIGFSELLLVMVIGLVVLGPERLPVAVKTVAGWIRALRSLAANVQNELAQELKLQELQESLKKVEEEAGLQNLSPELKASMDELKEAAESLKKAYQNEPDVGNMKASETDAVAPKPAASQIVASPILSSPVDDKAVSETKKKTSD
ncbi:Sec-independent protein translocase protein TatB [Photorhabdus sp. SF281]|uniref:Sec-independent protein translocase protein TatB n=1 Tax=Photorhabdus sp. SF281 TaxID=3459527 RepID=UPI004044001E